MTQQYATTICSKQLHTSQATSARQTCSSVVEERTIALLVLMNMSYFAYACKTEGQNGISRLISALCVNCLSSIPEYSRLNYLDEYLI